MTLKEKFNPGTFIAFGGMLWLLWQFVGPWAIVVSALGMVMYVAMYESEMRKRNAKRMRRQLRREARNHNTQVLSDMYDERHGA